MKRAFLTLVCLLLMATCAYAAAEVRWDPAEEAATGGSGGLVRTGRTKVHLAIIRGNTAGDIIGLYDGLNGYGSPVFEIEVGTALASETVTSDKGILFKTGLYVGLIETSVAEYYIVYDK